MLKTSAGGVGTTGIGVSDFGLTTGGVGLTRSGVSGFGLTAGGVDYGCNQLNMCLFTKKRPDDLSGLMINCSMRRVRSLKGLTR